MEMSHKDGICMYDQNHVIQIYDKNREVEERSLNITIFNMNDVLQIKLRDPLDYCFNFTENVDLGDFEIMRVNQNLDINFNEFKYNLIEMLQQFQKKEMLLKCEVSNQKCTLIFYCKSKIKAIVYLTIDLHMTNQKEIFSELLNNMQNIQETNERLKKQLSTLRKCVTEKEQEVQQLTALKNELEKHFCNNLKQIRDVFNIKIKDVETVLSNKITITKRRIAKLVKEVDVLKVETNRKSESNKKLIKTLESLQLDSNSNVALINNLKKENSALIATKTNQERYISDLQRKLQEKDGALTELQKKNAELQGDLEKTTVLMAQKKATIDELSKDLVQANQMLVNFNNHYDNKAKQVEELQGVVQAKDATIKEQSMRINELLREFDGYKACYNKEEQEKLKHELFLASNRVEELDNALRKANKINALLTDKVKAPLSNQY